MGLFAISTLAACALFDVHQKDSPLVSINSAFLRGDTFVIDYNVNVVTRRGAIPRSYWAEYRHGVEPVIHRERFAGRDAAGVAPIPVKDVAWLAGEEVSAEDLKSRLERAAKAVRDTGPQIYRIASPSGTSGADRYYLAYLGPGNAGLQVIELAPPQDERVHWGKVAGIAGIVTGIVAVAAVLAHCGGG